MNSKYGELVPDTMPDVPDGTCRMHTPLVLTTDMWPSHVDDQDPSSPVEQWVMEHSINGYSLGFDYSQRRPDRDMVVGMQRVVVIALRDVIAARMDTD